MRTIVATAGGIALLLAPLAPIPAQAQTACPAKPLTGYVIPTSSRQGPNLRVSGNAVTPSPTGWRDVSTPYRLTLQVLRADDGQGGIWMPVRTFGPGPRGVAVTTPPNTWRLVYQGTCSISDPLSSPFAR